jgi:hypothetical protein
MKFRDGKIKKEHHMIDGALPWLEDLSEIDGVTDIIPGVIDVTNSRERGVYYKYATRTGCKLLLKNSGALQEVFVVTTNPELVSAWATKLSEPLRRYQSEKEVPGRQKKQSAGAQEILQDKESRRDSLRYGIPEDVKLVEINQKLRDAYVDSLAVSGDPRLAQSLSPEVVEALLKMKDGLDA